MKFILSLGTLIVLINIFNLASQAETNDQFEFDQKIIQLTDKSFEEQLSLNEKKNVVMLVMFYAPWCGHCKRLKTTWNEIANELAEKQNLNITLAAVNCDNEKEISSRMRVSGYPTVFAFYKGENYKFKDRRTKETLINFALYEFLNTEGVALPKPPTTTEVIMETLFEVFEVLLSLIKAYPYITGGVALVFLILIVLLIKMIIDDIRETKEDQRQVEEKKKKELLMKQEKKDN